MAEQLTARQRGILDMIETSMRERGYPPSVREIGEAVGLTSPSTVHSHLASLSASAYLRRDPTKPRAIEVRFDPSSGAAIERRPVRHVPLVGDVAAGTDVLAQENVEELFPLPEDFTGDGELFMLRVRGDSMIEVGIMDGDFVVARAQQSTANNGEIVVAGIPGEEATVKTYQRKGNARHARAGQPPAAADGVRPPTRSDLRPCRHGDASPLTARPRCRPRARRWPIVFIEAHVTLRVLADRDHEVIVLVGRGR
jgi:repressor LexA